MEVRGAVEGSDETMQIDPSSLENQASQSLENQVADNELLSQDTMQMDDSSIEEASKKEDMEASFNAQTMAMDQETLEKELAASTGKQNIPEEDAGKTMDLSKTERPKTIMIKRPSSAPNAPTVKASRPPVSGAAKAVTANPSQPKEGTSRIDVPAGELDAGKEGKTIKLRRPSGAPGGSPSTKAKAASVARQAGLDLNEDGSVSIRPQDEKPLGGGWTAVAIVTFLISLGALYVVWAPSNPDLPMPGRLVDANNQLIAR
jgi:hypothetical protein